MGCDCSASIAKCHTVHAIAYPLSHYIDGINLYIYMRLCANSTATCMYALDITQVNDLYITDMARSRPEQVGGNPAKVVRQREGRETHVLED